MTYGEAHTWRKMSLRLEKGVFVADPLLKHNKQMSKDDAIKYYNNKCRTIFAVLGYKYDDSSGEFEKKFANAFKKVRKATNNMIKREVQKLRSA